MQIILILTGQKTSSCHGELPKRKSKYNSNILVQLNPINIKYIERTYEMSPCQFFNWFYTTYVNLSICENK